MHARVCSPKNQNLGVTIVLTKPHNEKRRICRQLNALISAYADFQIFKLWIVNKYADQRPTNAIDPKLDNYVKKSIKGVYTYIGADARLVDSTTIRNSVLYHKNIINQADHCRRVA